MCQFTPRRGGGVPLRRSRRGDTPSQVQVGGTTSHIQGVPPFPGPGRGYPLPRSRWGEYPFSDLLNGVPPTLGRVYPHPDLRMGTPLPAPGKGVTPHPLPPSRTGWGPPIRKQSSIGGTCYAAGGMSLAFTQEDFVVCITLKIGSVPVSL